MWGRRRRSSNAGTRPARRRDARHIVNLRFTYRVENHVWQAFSRDVSTSGAFLKTDHRLPLGTRVQVRFNIPGETDPVECDAWVRRATPFHPSDPHSAGLAVEFDDLAARDAERLDRFVRRHLPRTLFGMFQT